MKLDIIAVYEILNGYISEMQKANADYNSLWDKYAIEPYWKEISKWTPFDMSDRKPKPIKDIGKLKEQIKLLKEMNIIILYGEIIGM